jgi:hypothetical protein
VGGQRAGQRSDSGAVVKDEGDLISAGSLVGPTLKAQVERNFLPPSTC